MLAHTISSFGCILLCILLGPVTAPAQTSLPIADSGVILVGGFELEPAIDARDQWLATAAEETLSWRLRRVNGLVTMPSMRAYQARREIADGTPETVAWPRISKLMGVRHWISGTIGGNPDAFRLKLNIEDLNSAGSTPTAGTFGPGKLFAVMNEATAWVLQQLKVPQLDARTQQIVLAQPAISPSALEFYAKAVIAARSENAKDALYYAEQALQYDPEYRPALLTLTHLEMRLKPRTRAAAAVRLKRMHDLVQRAADRIDEAEITQAEGQLDMLVQSYDAAQTRFEDGLRMARDARDPYGELLVMNRLSDLWLARAADLDPKMPEADRNRQQREYLEKSIQWQRDTLEVLRKRNDILGEAPSAVKLALLYEKTEQFDKALEAYQSTLHASRAAGSKRAEATALMFLGQCYRKSGRVSEAVESLNACLNLAGKEDRPMARVALAELLQDPAVNKLEDAALQLEQACKELEDGELTALLRGLRSLAEVRIKQAQPRKAIEVLSQARDVANALRSGEEKEIVRQLEAIKAGKTP